MSGPQRPPLPLVPGSELKPAQFFAASNRNVASNAHFAAPPDFARPDRRSKAKLHGRAGSVLCITA
jgi:hypothetical protein